ncbi:MAG: hypothetical protein A2487_16905 [Candidatus Raymondbacteria bacterium RifOxyC12_full_50_8]|uniref:LysM domain-containing protein n=1 Tax=Candidatus Raymondbacteria bacterium RIFOXYD12_FULL_49_13 TaxID=1817890 RepID=A0A1F7F094_UNCRA|nr:MAG: hypothetical protein A2248_21780 [Candidatus Raymondbacteria bacterium RIFOXYA2_FULL_49_16]OGK00069.1 MAG: hypothetical protein A2519_22335 [Candidatus Raymondbacteria bacterium RIFOXYD12_FULL_49_13]OGK01358.1 MAG: hypothetical protein A2487_16905 [Candidatus Raymondbacteria bacterium RifOxyC12_full_50_8]OGK03686.1 MAG: hypothetical protein A2350_13015 [Candidatus Raymondbacteria bacterium RifOxyB12_full_50_8]OGP45058.1 MAG: hypothetical protein A2324_13660 [Candidatus Raymondbacteria b
MKKTLPFILAAALFFPMVLSAQEEMTYEQWELGIADAQKREQEAKAKIAGEQSQITALKEQIAQAVKQTEATRQEALSQIGKTPEEISAWNEKIDELVRKLQDLNMLSPDELVKRISELKGIESTLTTLKQAKEALLFASIARIAEVEGLIQQVRSNLPDKPMSYQVRLIPQNRDCLWRIAGYQEIYNDPLQWPRLYEANKDQIDKTYARYSRNTADAKYEKAADLIFPGQVFDIPR